jgi:phosphate transport system protein
MGRTIGSWCHGLAGPVPGTPPTAAQLQDLAAGASRLEDEAFTILAREAPVSSDLRATIAVVRSTYDLLRAGRLVRHIADGLGTITREADRLGRTRADDLAGLQDVAVEVFGGGVAAWEVHDVLAVGELRALDTQLGLRRDRLLAELPAFERTETTIAYVLVCRYFERLGDHGVNLSAQVAWAETGDRVIGHSVLGGPSH